MSNKKIISFLLSSIMCLSFVGCGNNNVAKEQSATTKQTEKYTDKEITVSAAASLTDSINQIASDFEKDTGVKVKLNFGGTNTLKTQVKEGFAVDVFLSANFKHYDDLNTNGYFTDGKKFVKNSLVLIVNKDNQGVKGLEDLTKEGVKFITTGADVPIGKYARQVLDNLNTLYGETYNDSVLKNIVSQESNVRQVVSKIALGEADCGLVYKTDVTNDVKDNLVVYDIDDKYNVIGEYWVGLMKTDKPKDSAKGFYDYITSENAKAVFDNYGFRTQI